MLFFGDKIWYIVVRYKKKDSFSKGPILQLYEYDPYEMKILGHILCISTMQRDIN